MERRAIIAELRAIEGRRLEGLVAPFDRPARIGPVTETIRAGAFRATLAASPDVPALVDHDPGRLLGRTRSKTLRLSETDRGLAFSLDLPDTALAHDVLALATRGDIGGMSFGFRATDEAWPARDRRELRAVDLLEVSIIHAWPVYGGTEVHARSRASRGAGDRIRLFLETVVTK